MSLFVDTSVWSLALRRDTVASAPEVAALQSALHGEQQVITTGLVLQELLQGFAGPKARNLIVARLSALAFVPPDRNDHLEAAEIRNQCRRRGVQVGTIDALLIQLCRRHDLTMLSTDRDVVSAAAHVDFRVWSPA
jgi:predicted nucleic acid-binding protein